MLCPVQPISLHQATKNHAVVIDALLGTGQSRAPAGDYAEACLFMNHACSHRVYALDIPTGIDPNTGSPFDEVFVRVDGCFSFGKPKYIAYRNADFGTLINIDIGFDLLPSPLPAAYLLEKSDLQQWWPLESSSSAKWTKGPWLPWLPWCRGSDSTRIR